MDRAWVGGAVPALASGASPKSVATSGAHTRTPMSSIPMSLPPVSPAVLTVSKYKVPALGGTTRLISYNNHAPEVIDGVLVAKTPRVDDRTRNRTRAPVAVA